MRDRLDTGFQISGVVAVFFAIFVTVVPATTPAAQNIYIGVAIALAVITIGFLIAKNIVGSREDARREGSLATVVNDLVAFIDRGNAIAAEHRANNSDLIAADAPKWVAEVSAYLRAHDPALAVRFDTAPISGAVLAGHSFKMGGYWQELASKNRMLAEILTEMRRQ